MLRPLGLILFLPILLAGAWSRSAPATILIDFSGYSWEAEGFPPSSPGIRLEIAAPLGSIGSPLNDYTMRISNMVSAGTEQPGPHNLVTQYEPETDGGNLVIIEDERPAGIQAGSGTEPADLGSSCSFRNGSVYLAGSIERITVYYDTQFHSGAFEAMILFIGGSHLGELGAVPPIAMMTGGVFVFDSPGGGYDVEWDGQISLNRVLSTASTTWGAIKSHYATEGE